MDNIRVILFAGQTLIGFSKQVRTHNQSRYIYNLIISSENLKNLFWEIDKKIITVCDTKSNASPMAGILG